jgi:hypothetical protein
VTDRERTTLDTGIDMAALERQTAEGTSYLGDILVTTALMRNFCGAVIPLFAEDEGRKAKVDALIDPYIAPLLGEPSNVYEPVQGWNQSDGGGLTLRIAQLSGADPESDPADLIRLFFWLTVDELRQILEAEDANPDNETLEMELGGMFDRRGLFLATGL